MSYIRGLVIRSPRIFAVAFLSVFYGSVTAQSGLSPESGEPSPAAPRVWKVGPVAMSGYADGYYTFNSNNPTDTANGKVNDLYNFNDKTNRFMLGAAKLSLRHDPAPVGIQVDMLFGRAHTLLRSASDMAKYNYIEQAFISVKPADMHGAQLDFGQFVTSAGAEVIDAKDNWFYSHSLLFSWAIPYFHFGLRSSLPVTKSWTAGLQIVNGWNNVFENNGGATVGFTSNLARTKFGWTVNVYTGPEKTSGQSGYRNLIDTVLTLNPAANWIVSLNYDYGQNRLSFTNNGLEPSAHWQGIAFATRRQLAGRSAIAGRLEYFDDNQGYSTGRAQALKEATATYEYKWLSGLVSRVEYRRDWSNVDFFHKGSTGFVDSQPTLTGALIASF